MTQGLLIIVSAPSGAGKTSLVAALMARDPQLTMSVSHTTRTRRQREQDGINYHFVSRQQFLEMVRQQAFVEHAEVFGHLYGTSSGSVAAERDQGRDVILEIDYQGARQIRERYPEAISIFIVPPSLATLAARLEGRAEDARSVIEQRLAMARSEMSSFAEYDYLVVNDDFEAALEDMACIVRAERLRVVNQRERLAPLLGELLSDL
jgi:guanylate kinase